MLKNILKPDKKGLSKAKDVLTLEVAELQEIAEKLFQRIDGKIKALKAAEKSADKKIERLSKLLERLEDLDLPADLAMAPRYREIKNLAKKGLKVDEIANILDIPVGEVELIMDLDK